MVREIGRYLSSNPPFPNSAHPAGHVPLDSLQRIRAWLPIVEEMVMPVAVSLSMHFEDAMRTVSAFDPTKGESLPPDIPSSRLRDDIHAALSTTGRSVVQSLAEFLGAVQGIIADTHVKLAQVERYKRRLPSPIALLVGVCWATSVFALGVFWPMVDATASTTWVAWLPGISYLVLLLGAITWVSVRYVPTMRAER
jgi:hypothetical protein